MWRHIHTRRTVYHKLEPFQSFTYLKWNIMQRLLWFISDNLRHFLSCHVFDSDLVLATNMREREREREREWEREIVIVYVQEYSPVYTVVVPLTDGQLFLPQTV